MIAVIVIGIICAIIGLSCCVVSGREAERERKR